MKPTAPVPTEAECQRTIIEAAKMLGYRCHHTRPAQTRRGWRTAISGDVGFPDCVIAGHGKCFIVELKRRDNRVTPDQDAWLRELRYAGLDAAVWWMPDQLQELLDRLTRYAQRYKRGTA